MWVPEEDRPTALVPKCSVLPPGHRCDHVPNSGMSAMGSGQITWEGNAVTMSAMGSGQITREGNAVAITIQDPNCMAAILNWNSMYLLLQHQFELQRDLCPLSPAGVPALAVDGLCHVDTLANQLGLSIKETLRQCEEEAPKPCLRLVGVITNCVFYVYRYVSFLGEVPLTRTPFGS